METGSSRLAARTAPEAAKDKHTNARVATAGGSPGVKRASPFEVPPLVRGQNFQVSHPSKLKKAIGANQISAKWSMRQARSRFITAPMDKASARVRARLFRCVFHWCQPIQRPDKKAATCRHI